MFEFFAAGTPELIDQNSNVNISSINNIISNANNVNSNITYDNVANNNNNNNNDNNNNIVNISNTTNSNSINNDNNILNSNNYDNNKKNNNSNNNNNDGNNSINIQNYRKNIDNNSNDNSILDNEKVYKMLMKTKIYHNETPLIQSFQEQNSSKMILTCDRSETEKTEHNNGIFIDKKYEPNYIIGNSKEMENVTESKEDSLLQLNKLLKDNSKNEFAGHSQIPEKNPIFCIFPEKISPQVEVAKNIEIHPVEVEVKKFDEMRNVLRNSNMRNVLQNISPSIVGVANFDKKNVNDNDSKLKNEIHEDLNINMNSIIKFGKYEGNSLINHDIDSNDLNVSVSFLDNNKDNNSNNHLLGFHEEDTLIDGQIIKTNFDIFLDGEVIGADSQIDEVVLEESDFDGYLN